MTRYTVQVPFTGERIINLEADSPESAITNSQSRKEGKDVFNFKWDEARATPSKEIKRETDPAPKKLQWDKIDTLLGKYSDAEIAKAFQCSIKSISNRRKELGIFPPKAKKIVDWSQWDDKLGTMSDNTLCVEIGCSRGTVIARRKRLNIPAFNDKPALDLSKLDF